MPATTGLTIPFSGLRKQYHTIRGEILDATDEVLRSGQLMNGNHTVEFENWLQKKNQVKYAICCHSGTQALEILAEWFLKQLAVSDLPLTPTVLIPSITYVATANAFARAGWDIHFIDTDAHGILNYSKIPQGVAYQAVVLVGLYGHSLSNYGDFRNWTEWKHKDVVVIEDAAQHWLASDCQRISSGSAISFDPTKNLAANGNGGAVLTDLYDLAEFARSWRDNGRNSGHQHAGTNSRMSEIDCAHMLIKTAHLDAWQRRRGAIAEFWIEKCKNKNLRCLIDESNLHSHALHKFVIDIDSRDTVHSQLAARKIETKIHYRQPLHELSGWFSTVPGPGLLSAASAMSRRVLSLPFYPELTDLEVEYIIDQLLALV
jgi:dTDP-4-amino-4,6-dideoxygalactose transaminase